MNAEATRQESAEPANDVRVPHYFQAVAIDYDGTLTTGGRPHENVLEGLAKARSRGLKIVLVTGRIVRELREVFPDFSRYFDAVVAENGAVLADADGGTRPIAAGVPGLLESALVDRGVVLRRGDVILATSSHFDATVSEEIRKGGYDCQVLGNRGETMILPAGISKGSGVRAALLELGISLHSTVAIGDAENDHALLDACEIGVAPANAITALRAHADIVLPESNGAAVLRLLEGSILSSGVHVVPRRWQVSLGNDARGRQVLLPASGVNLLVAGGSKSGKSFAAGAIAEQLARLGYVLCVLDPEGDHAPLGGLPGVATVGGHEHLPEPEDVARILRQSMSSIIVDLSHATPRDKKGYALRLLQILEHQRRQVGLPHWLFVDEAHALLGSTTSSAFDQSLKGHCLSTYRPEGLSDPAVGATDFVLLTHGSPLNASSAAMLHARFGLAEGELRGHIPREGSAFLFDVGARPTRRPFQLAARAVEHVRHWHKYAREPLPYERRFVFRHPSGIAVAEAASLDEFARHLDVCDGATVKRHAIAGDFSRWIREVLGDDRLAAMVAADERGITAASSESVARFAKADIIDSVNQRYLLEDAVH